MPALIFCAVGSEYLFDRRSLMNWYVAIIAKLSMPTDLCIRYDRIICHIISGECNFPNMQTYTKAAQIRIDSCDV